MRNIGILDCTLRDGGYVNNWNFKEKDTLRTVEYLFDADIEIVECGFLDSINGYDTDSTRFKSIERANSLFNGIDLDSKLLVAMIEYSKYDIDTLPVVDNYSKIRGIRFSFRKSDYQKAIVEMPKIIAKGYKLFIQPISTSSYSDDELDLLLNKANELCAYALYIVDTQGSMFRDDFQKLYIRFDKLLNKNIKVGFHSHNNMQLSYSIAIDFIDCDTSRDIIVDASVYGMGRGAGNLNTELVADYLNKKQKKSYKTEYILELIDSFYYAIYKTNGWGYSLAHFLSASLGCHPNYASYLLDKKHLSINEIEQILKKVPESESFEYNKNIIENIYFDFNSTKIQTINEPLFDTHKKILLLGSGKSVEQKVDIIQGNRADYIIIALNHKPKELEADFYFFNSIKRYAEFSAFVEKDKLIVASNLNVTTKYILDYKELSFIDINTYNDNSAVMIINYLYKRGFLKAYLAGVDGFSKTAQNYRYEENNQVVDAQAIDELNEGIKKSLLALSKYINIEFLTKSIFEVRSKPRVIGVIPSRYASTRLPQKPLVDIEGFPMVIHVMKRAMMCEDLDEVIVATDDQKIFDTVGNFGGVAMMTSHTHQNGTLRMHEISTKVNGDIFVLLNGDEPLIEPKFIKESVEGLVSSPKAVASLLVTPYSERNNQSNFKVALNNYNEVMYISRNDIPSDARSSQKPMWKAFHIVSYRKEFLDIYATELEQTEFDAREMDDQLRILEYGYTIQAVKTQSNAISVDTSDDLEKVRSLMREDKLFKLYRG